MSSSRSVASDIARTVLRVALGAVFFAHGWQKFFEYTIPGAQGAFAQMGVPAAQLAAPISAGLELIGGALLVVGLLTRVAGALLAVEMLSALFLVHISAGMFVEKGGMELVLILAAASAAVALVGPGRLSLDAALFGRRTGKLALLAA
ncbi:membrane protein [Sinomonas cellulolyticus]|uniref:DoxX family protein n=1 Tax=Sinomonas cellulolyticus TaxID=2801916 RepID=A0ABS1K0V6_9MICC|nr:MULTISPECIES: DoxX family protein [Sinomonas]MBL0704517.1 DoxX family protein [Sinomonas cellulolyticus]GHG49136.1 membrane protein [Sinomonas sp. KCTC 49339]